MCVAMRTTQWSLLCVCVCVLALCVLSLYTQIRRDYRTPEGMSASEVDADSDGDVLVVLDLRVDDALVSAGVAREIVNRYVKLRVRACACACLSDWPSKLDRQGSVRFRCVSLVWAK